MNRFFLYLSKTRVCFMKRTEKGEKSMEKNNNKNKRKIITRIIINVIKIANKHIL